VDRKIQHEDCVKNFSTISSILYFLFIYIAIYVVLNFVVRISLQVGTGKKLEGIDCHLT
jgi:hypothetical protein